MMNPDVKRELAPLEDSRFKEFYEAHYGPFPGSPGEQQDVIFARLCVALVIYTELMVDNLERRVNI